MLLNRVVDLYERWGKPDQAESYRQLLPVPSVAWLRELGPLPVEGHVGGAFSATVGGRSLWVFWGREPGMDPTHDMHGSSVAAVWTEDPSPLHMEWRSVERFLPLTPEEIEHNRAHNAENCVEDCGSHWDLDPGAVATDPESGKVFVFYSKKFYPKPGLCGNECRVGTSVAVLSGSDETPSRPVVGPGGRYPTLLFGAGEPHWGSGALVRDGYLYAYAFTKEELTCLLTRVETSKVLDRTAWRFYAGPRGWSADWQDAQHVIGGASALTVHWNEYLRKYLAVHNAPLENNLVMRIADRPEGPWSDPVAIIEEEEPESWWNYYGLGHAHLAREGGRIETVSYFRPGTFFDGTVRLVEVAFR